MEIIEVYIYEGLYDKNNPKHKKLYIKKNERYTLRLQHETVEGTISGVISGICGKELVVKNGKSHYKEEREVIGPRYMRFRYICDVVREFEERTIPFYEIYGID